MEKKIELIDTRINSNASSLLRVGKKMTNIVDVFRGRYRNDSDEVAVKRIRLEWLRLKVISAV